MCFEPCDGVGGLEAGECAAQGGATARVVGGKRSWVEARVGDIAAATAGDAHFGEHLGAALENVHIHVRRMFSAGDGAEEAGRAAADDDNVHDGNCRRARIAS